MRKKTIEERRKFQQVDEDILDAVNSKIEKGNTKKADLISIISVCEENMQKRALF